MRFRIFLKVVPFAFLLALLISCRTLYVIKENATQAGVILIDSNYSETDSVSLAIIAPYKAAMESEMEEVIAYSDEPMSKAQPEGLLNNFVADLVLFMAGKYYSDGAVDFCLMNNGGLRSSLPKGEIKVRNIYELMPFENKISILVLDGQNCLKLFNYVAGEGGMPVAGITMGIKNEEASSIFIQSAPFDSTRNYTVATVDYLADGGDKMIFFKSPVKRTDLPVLIRNAIIEYMRNLTAEGKTLSSSLDGRIFYER